MLLLLLLMLFTFKHPAETTDCTLPTTPAMLLLLLLLIRVLLLLLLLLLMLPSCCCCCCCCCCWACDATSRFSEAVVVVTLFTRGVCILTPGDFRNGRKSSLLFIITMTWSDHSKGGSDDRCKRCSNVHESCSVFASGGGCFSQAADDWSKNGNLHELTFKFSLDTPKNIFDKAQHCSTICSVVFSLLFHTGLYFYANGYSISIRFFITFITAQKQPVANCCGVVLTSFHTSFRHTRTHARTYGVNSINFS
uniref:Secreted peptide n=1 Tax=Anopheles braziliensis TaxID=58242 RepID=A0A2M3ZM29_9DIPT